MHHLSFGSVEGEGKVMRLFIAEIVAAVDQHRHITFWGYLSKTAKFPATTSKPLLRFPLRGKIDFRYYKANFITHWTSGSI